MTYGEKLLAQQAERERDKDLGQRQRAAQADKDRGSNEMALIGFLASVFKGFTQAIDDNVPPKPVRMPREIDALSGRHSEIGPDSPQHPFHDLYLAYCTQIAQQHRLRFVFSPSHDGVGIESWIEVSMAPLMPGETFPPAVGIEALMVPHTIEATKGFICVKPDGSLIWPSFKPTRNESVQFGVGAGIRGAMSDQFMEDKAKAGFRCVPVVLASE